MKPLLALAAFALLGAAGPAPRLERIELSAKSWGRPVADWHIDAEGAGSYTAPEPSVHEATRMVTKDFVVGSQGFRELRLMLARAEKRRGRALPCANRITDQVYGEIRWTRRDGSVTRLAFDNGCQDAVARHTLAEIRRAQDLVAQWVKDAPVASTSPVEKP